MSQYRYQPGPAGQNNSNDDLVGWVVTIIALVAFWPVGLFLLFRKLSGSSLTRSGSQSRTGRTTQTTYRYTPQGSARAQSTPSGSGQAPTGETRPNGEYHYRYHTAGAAKAAQTGAQTTQAGPAPTQASAAPKAAPRASRAPSPLDVRLPSGKGLMTIGAIIALIFGFCLTISFTNAIAGGFLRDVLAGLGALSFFTGLGGVLFAGGLFRRRQSRRFRKYLALIGRRDAVPISTLAKATGRKYKKVCDDLQTMLDRGVLPVGYLDLANDRLVLSAEGIVDADEEEEEEEEAPPAKQDDNDILAEIRGVNDQIADPVMSAKIDRIGEITGKILDYQRKNPSKAGQLRSFLSYYLPTTLKILRAYAQLEEQGIEGENISAAKARIEGMMDKVVEGFEKQLDKLFQDDALDITTDVAVLEKMLDKDGLSQGGLTLGG